MASGQNKAKEKADDYESMSLRTRMILYDPKKKKAGSFIENSFPAIEQRADA